jgi:EAL domain-containing protein (putative c-di-GMP-specific phosphodiesterase class I)
MGAEYMQGFYFSKAIPEDEFIELVSKGDSQVPVIEDDFN